MLDSDHSGQHNLHLPPSNDIPSQLQWHLAKEDRARCQIINFSWITDLHKLVVNLITVVHTYYIFKTVRKVDTLYIIFCILQHKVICLSIKVKLKLNSFQTMVWRSRGFNHRLGSIWKKTRVIRCELQMYVIQAIC